MDLVTATSPRQLDPYGRVIERILSTTLQPSTLPYRPPKGAIDSLPQRSSSDGDDADAAQQ
jgi:hypothetical protein